MRLETKSRPMKASTDVDGKFRALVSVFDNVDFDGDVVASGAFKRTLEERGLPPVFYSHQWNDIHALVGMTESAVETDDGLEIEAQLFMDSWGGKQIHRALSVGALREFSFAYDVRDAGEEVRDGRTVRLLKDLELYEVGPTLVGANPATELLDVRSALPRALEGEPRDGDAEHEPGRRENDDLDAAHVRRVRGLLLARPR